MKWLTDKMVADKMGMSVSLVWRLVKEKLLPEPIKLDETLNVNKTVWIEDEVEGVMKKAVDAARGLISPRT